MLVQWSEGRYENWESPINPHCLCLSDDTLTISRLSLLDRVYVRGSQISHTGGKSVTCRGIHILASPEPHHSSVSLCETDVKLTGLSFTYLFLGHFWNKGMMFASFHPKGTIPSCSDMLNTCASGVLILFYSFFQYFR